MRFFIVIVRAPICPLYQEAWQHGSLNDANGKILQDLKIATDLFIYLYFVVISSFS